ncbi:MAG: (d)CMP kinase, partial [Methylobacter sp.]|nr:(d)CMP kinase [Methylobacter sp.]
MNIPVLTIDGPSGAGKGTVSRAVAKNLGWNYLDSGSIYRSLAVAALKQQVELENEAAIVNIAKAMVLEFDCGDELVVRLDGENITAQLGLESTGNAASIVAALPEVRRVLLQKQKDFKRLPGLVADGRDMGTVVFPDAENKVFLTASAAERAKRRYKQLIEKGIDANLAQITNEIEERDRRDMERKAAPLAMSSDAFYIDSSDMALEAVIEE